ncbi:(2,3-dihydroxybenzoyl)adenylate synthase [Corynebacterium cystitidis]|uniref:2,3-dihydroxybenzoate-AMP ligase n=1 Tax=Corynebacterium cystitidis DSM 20524 TaxID=1121357 RepID=A0A1H9RFH7_9CORY|nr:AMP-binding protein [Corynebacterium cystitidis]WJY81453.1 2,3-dihydroxybenzoate-AMP ligase [Corynebacterium cystitidis DSM 20524]SER71387.1 2,3-dihydroxybenzoate-AMP ligase [Corynebacterium cystitidis DSM 20524]SNV87320.1 2,3-dihydroxybenzoate-AMP ligase [Corynebacterium cystitidis]
MENQCDRDDFHPERRFYPAEFAHAYRAAGYWNDDTLASLVSDTARAHPEKEAVVGHTTAGLYERFSYRELLTRIRNASAQLAQAGVQPRDRVLVQLPNVTEYMVALFAVFHLGAIPVFTLPAHREAELTHFVKMSQATALITCQKFAGFDFQELACQIKARHPDLTVVVVGDQETVDKDHAWLDCAQVTTPPDSVQQPAQLHPESLAFLQLSGGTTGTPKLIPRTHADYLYSVRESVEICQLGDHTRMLVVLPAAHNFTMSSPGILGAVWAAATVVFARDPSPSTCFKLIEEERISITALVPPLAMTWLATKPKIERDISSLQLLQVGGAKLNEEAARRITPELGCQLQQVFGMAEGLVNYTRRQDDFELTVTSQGRPISPADEVLIVNDVGEPVSLGQRGHLFTRGPYTIRGYIGGVDAGSFTEDGFYRTGDIVRRLPSGHLVVEGRDKDQINRSGEKISAEEIENHLLAYPGVLDVAVVGVPDELRGERSCAFILTEQALTDDLIRDFLRDRGLAIFKIPDQVVLTSTFPTTGVGKLSRKELRRRLLTTLSKD